jgi:methylmalonyl-CoA mutase cobalamin-binding subunit
MLVTHGVATVQLGVQTPLTEIVRAAAMHDVDAVCLSFSSAFPAGQLSRGITDLRAALPLGRALWVGGAAVRSLRKPPEGVRLLPELPDIPVALAALRNEMA